MISPFSVRERLRKRTGSLHAHVDFRAAGMRLETASGYARFLTSQASVILPLEDALESAGVMRLLADWGDRCRSEALKADLLEIGASCFPVSPPVFKSDAALLGALYVLEGSRLGARVILSRIGFCSATRYLRHGEGLRLWPSFLEILESDEGVRQHPDAAEDAARLVFEMFAQAMEPQEMAVAS